MILAFSLSGWLASRPVLKQWRKEGGFQGVYARAKEKLRSFCRDLLADPIIRRRMRKERESCQRVVGGVHLPPAERKARCAANADAVEVNHE